MVKAMKYRDMEHALADQQCTHLRTRGSHHIWGCPCGKHRVSIAPQKGIVSPGVARDAIRKLTCLPEGWLQ
jgi:predicted RNA binding protein YcfA (HicA-like mRNA interferase family)